MRRWARAWSPQQISARLWIDFPEDATMRSSHEAIHQSLYVQGRGALRRELTACLRTGACCACLGPASGAGASPSSRPR
jgi:IS30 family transposase